MDNTNKIRTKIMSQGAVHYTCNSVKESTCNKLGILMIGEAIGRAARELLVIPLKLFKGKPVNEITAENLLRDLTRKHEGKG